MTDIEQAMVESDLGATIHKPTPAATKQRAVDRAAMGHLVPVMVGLPFVLLQKIPVTFEQWSFTFFAVISVWLGLWLVLRAGLDRHLAFDPHFLLLPAGLSTPLVGLYIFMLPELRYLLLQGWYAVLLFGAGLLGFRAAVILNTIMTAVYFAVIGALIAGGSRFSWGAEISAIIPFYALCFFCAMVLERLRRDRREMKSLRRQMSRLALTDKLTGLPNRRHLEEAMERQAARSLRDGSPYALAIIDIDFFKEINDTYGHETGDLVLEGISEIFRSVFRKSDLVGRLGGDEFAIMLPDTTIHGAARLLERLRSEVQHHGHTRARLQRHQVTVSIGLAEARHDDTPADVLRRADERLYVAKKCGRNRVAMMSLGAVADQHQTVALGMTS